MRVGEGSRSEDLGRAPEDHGSQVLRWSRTVRRQESRSKKWIVGGGGLKGLELGGLKDLGTPARPSVCPQEPVVEPWGGTSHWRRGGEGLRSKDHLRGCWNH